MSWMTTANGRLYHLDGAAIAHNPIEIDDIAHSLAQINRFTGHASRPYSVAEHSLLVCDIAKDAGLPVHGQMAALMHDAHESYVGDVSSPMKWAIGTAWQDVESSHAFQVRAKFGLATAFAAWRTAINKADLIALATERRDLVQYAPGCSEPWAVLDTPGREVLPYDCDLNAHWRHRYEWLRWRTAFLDRYHHLAAQIGQLAPQ